MRCDGIHPRHEFQESGDGAAPTASPAREIALPLALGAGGALGFLSGVTGIGGGIFLAPLLHALHWAPARRIAGAASLFILVNSLSGLAGQTAKLTQAKLAELAGGYWPLLLSVLIGGQIGSFLGSRRLPEGWIRRLTGVLILYVAVRLAWRFAMYFR
jgi:hypothetical protein